MLNPNKELTRGIENKLKPLRLAISRHLIMLSSGAILLTFTFIQIIEESFVYKDILKSAWILLGISILIGLFFQILILNQDAYWLVFSKNIPKDKKMESMSEEEKEIFFKTGQRYFKISLLVFIAELIHFFTFFVGIILIIVFMFFNF